MKLSGEIKINNNKSFEFSKCGNYLAYGSGNLLKIINVESLEIISTFPCTNGIKVVRWHYDSDLVFSVLDDKVEAFSVSDPKWMCTIKEGEPGLIQAVWSPKNYYILTLAKFNVRISVWSLTAKTVTCINNPILKTDNFSFSCDESYFAVIAGSPGEYKILIYSTSTWILNQEIPCSCEVTVPSNPLWSPTNLHFVIWDTLDPKSVFLEIYCVEKTKKIGSFKKTESYKLCGVSQVVWVPSGQFLLIGCYNECVFVLNYITWGVLLILRHSQILSEKSYDVFEEMESASEFNLIKQRPVILSKLKPSVSGPAQITKIICDSCGNYVATQSSSMPAIVWIWEVGMFSLKSVVILKNIISDITWSSRKLGLLVCCKSNNVVLWRPDDIIHIHFSQSFNYTLFISNCVWCPKRDATFSIVSGLTAFIVQNFT